MNRILIAPVLLLLCLSSIAASSQVPASIAIQILKAEDARAYNETLEDLMKHPHYDVRTRAALAAGRIGSEAAIPALLPLLERGTTAKEREMAAFALGEIESIKAADGILNALAETGSAMSLPGIQARLVEGAGKIAAANPKDPKSKDLGEAILDTLEAEDRKGAKQSREVIALALTAALSAAPRDANRARPDDTDLVVAKFLTNLDARIRADAANTLSRIRAKNANEALRAMLLSDGDPIARANAARALGAAEDKMAFDLLLEGATGDDDSRVRVSAIRSLGNLNDRKAAGPLLQRATTLIAAYPKSMISNPSTKNELLAISAVLGKILSATNDENAIKFLLTFKDWDNSQSPEIEVALTKVSPVIYLKAETSLISHSVKALTEAVFLDWHVISGRSTGLKELASSENPGVRSAGRQWLQDFLMGKLYDEKKTVVSSYVYAVPEALRAYAAYTPDDLNDALIANIKSSDPMIRAAAAELFAARPPTKQNLEILKTALDKALITDTKYNDAQLAILDALFKLDKSEAIPALLKAANATDYLVRKKAFELLKDESFKDSDQIKVKLGRFNADRRNQVLPYLGKGSKLGVILNTQADYIRAASRKNGTVKAVFTTERGGFTIELLPEDAPLTVDNFIKLAKSGYFNGLEVHRVVPNFVMQDGDPRGDGNGGPGWSIRCEINMVPYERGAVGMALSGKDTGGSQWFVTHSPQPHLDGGYTVFGRVNETDMKVVDNIVRGDKIISVKIMETGSPKKTQRVVRKK